MPENFFPFFLGGGQAAPASYAYAKDLANIFRTLPGPGEFQELAPPLLSTGVWHTAAGNALSYCRHRNTVLLHVGLFFDNKTVISANPADESDLGDRRPLIQHLSDSHLL